MEPFSYTHVVRFSEVDAAGVAFFSRFFEWAHHAWESLLGRAHGDWFSEMKRAGYGLPLVSAHADFHRPARLGTALVVRPVLKEANARRLTVEFRVELEDGSQLAVVRHEHAFIDLKTFRPADGPTDFVDRLLDCGLERAR